MKDTSTHWIDVEMLENPTGDVPTDGAVSDWH